MIHLITTSEPTGARLPLLQRMLESLDRNCAGAERRRFDLHLLLQNSIVESDLDLGTLRDRLELNIHSIDGRLSLSAARNRLVRGVLPHLADDDILAFPDDDCWYPDGFSHELLERFSQDKDLDFWFCRYSPEPVAPPASAASDRLASLADLLHNASSNTIFVSGRLARLIGLFDENLGVGTKVPSAEDTDYAVRAFASSRKTIFQDAARVGHRPKNAVLRAKYYPGGLLVIARYVGRVDGMLAQLARKVLVGVALVLRRELRLADWASAVSNAWSHLGAV